MKLLLQDHPASAKLQSLREQIAALKGATAEQFMSARTADESSTRFLEWANGHRDTAIKAIARASVHFPDGPAYLAEQERDLDELQKNPVGFYLAIGGDAAEKQARKLFAQLCGSSGISSADHGARVSEIGAKAADLETQEERECMRLENEGWAVPRRKDIDAAVVWALWCEPQTEAAAA